MVLAGGFKMNFLYMLLVIWLAGCSSLESEDPAGVIADWKQGTLELDTVQAVEFSLLSDSTYIGAQTLVLQTSTDSAAIYYSTNDSTPTDHAQLYTKPIMIDSSMTIKAVAFRENWYPSKVDSGVYGIAHEVNFHLAYPEGNTNDTIQMTVLTPAKWVEEWPEDPEILGYAFAGWWTDQEGKGEQITDTVLIRASYQLHPKWMLETYQISYHNIEGVNDFTAPDTYTVISPVIELPNQLEKNGFQFIGWVTDTTNSLGIIESIQNQEMESVYSIPTGSTGNIQLYALWTTSLYTITFESYGGTTVEPISLPFGTTVTAPQDPTKTGHTFAGWNPALPTSMPDQNKTLTATWTANEYTITFESYGGTTVEPITLPFGDAVTPPQEPTKTGHTFAGWNPALPNTMPDQNQTLTATWTANEYTITFESDGGTTVEPITLSFGTTVTAPQDPTKTGHTFAGWDPALPTNMPDQNRTATAMWALDSFSVTLSGSTIPIMLTISIAYGDTIVKRIAERTRAGYEFVRWLSSIAIDSTSLMPDSDLHLEEVWAIRDSRDAQLYETVEIWSQEWLARNLNFAGNNNEIGVCYEGEATNCENGYGRLYSWAEAMYIDPAYNSNSYSDANEQDLCPSGWHIPSDEDWHELEKFLEMADSNLLKEDWRTGNARRIKSITGWTVQQGYNSFGFNALPAGNYNSQNVAYQKRGSDTYFWLSSQHSTNGSLAWFRNLHGGSNSNYLASANNVIGNSINRYHDEKVNKFSVRCLKNN
jgi:uncharacterized protein (TIGR02145 family)/uncharacterized repeat protein (TIGR02543 family)